MSGPVLCLRCGQPMRLETSHYRCSGCGYLTHCCEGDLAPYLPPDSVEHVEHEEEDAPPKTRRSEESPPDKK